MIKVDSKQSTGYKERKNFLEQDLSGMFISGLCILINGQELSSFLSLRNRKQETTPLSIKSYFGSRRIRSQSGWLNSSAMRKVPI